MKEKVEEITEIFVSSEDLELILNLKENEIVKYIQKELNKFEDDFKYLCDEFKVHFDKNELIKLSYDLCYIPELKAIIPDLATKKCYFQKSSEYFDIENLKDDSSFNEFFEKFKVIKEEKFINFVLSFEEAKFFGKYNIYKKQNNRNNKIVCCETEFVGLTYCDQCSQDNIEKYYLLDDDSSGYYGENDDGLILTFPINRLEEHSGYGTSVGAVLIYWLDNKIRPLESEFKSQKSKETYDLLRILYRKNKDWFTVDNDGYLVFAQEKKNIAKYFYDEYSKNNRKFTYFSKIEEMSKGELVADDDFIDNFKKKILDLEMSRCSFDTNDLTEEVFSNKRSGHWDLCDYNDLVKSKCESKKEKYIVVTLPKGNNFCKRDPFYDYDDNKDTIVAIDFGTKSTVVCYKDDQGFILPRKIARSSDSETGNEQDPYENPSVIEFVNLEKFIEDYKSKAGRPNTKWLDLIISHEASNDMLSKNDYNLFMTELKSWCAKDGKDVAYPIKDCAGYSYTFHSYLDVKTDIIDPIEIYAYYLGLYINKLSQCKIISRYEMSFPIKFIKPVRNRIMASFENGIKKSLPTALLNDEKFKSILKRRRLVREGLSEPAAYAITALEKYGFKDEVNNGNGDNFHYAVFDFGGGTTDFDFGIYSANDGSKYDEEDYDAILTHFGEHGLPNLGGEKLLKYLAFELFKLNAKQFKTQGIDVKFTSYDGAKSDEVHGYEDYIKSDSLHAMENMHQVMECLRWIWEDPKNKLAEQDNDRIISKGELQVLLYDENAKKRKDQILALNEGDQPIISFQKLLAEKIKNAIETFLDDLLIAFKDIAKKEDLSDVDKFHIFLAGNSSKSILFNQLLAKYFGDDYVIDDFSDLALTNFSSEEIQNEIEEILDTVDDSKVRELKEKLGNPDLEFKIYPPLRTKEAKLIIDEINKDNPNYKGYDINNKKEPSGKTGVAYGILASDKTYVEYLKPVGEDVPFDFFVGKSIKGNLELLLRKNAPKNVWSNIHLAKTKDNKDKYDFCYTKTLTGITSAKTMKLMPGNHIIGSIYTSDTENGDYIYIRPVEYNKIEWRIASDRSQLQDSDEVNQNCIITLKDN